MRHSAWLLACILSCAGASCALAQTESREGIALQNQILDLRRQIQELQGQVQRSQGGGQRGGSSGGGSFLGLGGGNDRPSPPAAQVNDITASLLERVSALEEEVRRQRGRQDEMANTQQRQYENLSKQIGDLNFKLQGPAASGAAPTGLPATSPPPASLGALPLSTPSGATQPPLTAPVRRTPEIALQEANAALARHDYPAAEAAARDVLTNNRTSPRAYDAQFVLAEALEGKRDNPQAAIAFDDAYNRSKTGAHAPDALLGLATSLGAINERKAACETLAKLQVEFPRARPDIRAAADAARQRNGCR